MYNKCTRVLTFEAGVCFEKGVAIRETLLGPENDATKVCPLYVPYMSLICPLYIIWPESSRRSIPSG